MLNAPRSPGYLSKPEYAHLAEVGQKLFLSSAWYKQSELYSMLKGYTINMLKENSKFFACDLPYQLSISSNIASDYVFHQIWSSSLYVSETAAIQLWFHIEQTSNLSCQTCL